MADSTDLDRWQAKLSYLTSLYGQRNADFTERDAIFELDHDTAFGWSKPEAPDDIRVVTAKPLKVVRHLVGLVTQNPFRVYATPRKDTKALKDRGDRLEKLLIGVLQQNQQRFGPVVVTGLTSGVVRGWGSWRVRWNQDLAKEADEDEEYAPMAVEWEAIDSRYVFYEPGGREERFQSVMYSITRRRVDVEREWDTSIVVHDESHNDPHDASVEDVVLTDYWWWEKGKVHNAVWCDYTVLKKDTTMPGYRGLPYVTWLVQPGYKSEPEHWATGTLHVMRKAVMNYDRAASRQMRTLTYEGDAMYLLEAADKEVQGLPEGYSMTIEAGTIETVPVGWKVNVLPRPPASQTAAMLMQVFSGEIDQLSVPPQSMGVLPEGDTDMSGVALHGVQDAGIAWMATDIDSLKRAFVNMFDLIIGLCGYYSPDKAIQVACATPGLQHDRVEYVDLTGEEMQDFTLVIDVDTDTAADKMRAAQLGLQILRQWQQDPLSAPYDKRTIQERYFDVQDVEKVERNLMAEAFLAQNPSVREYAMAKAAKAAGIPEPPPEPISSPPPVGQGQGIAGTPAPVPSGGMQRPPGMMPGQMAMPPSGMVSPQEMGGSPAPMPVQPGLPQMGGGQQGGGQIPPQLVAMLQQRMGAGARPGMQRPGRPMAPPMRR